MQRSLNQPHIRHEAHHLAMKQEQQLKWYKCRNKKKTRFRPVYIYIYIATLVPKQSARKPSLAKIGCRKGTKLNTSLVSKTGTPESHRE